MRNLPILMSRELRSMVLAPMFWVILVPFMLYNGITFYTLLLVLNQPYAPEGAPTQLFFGGSVLFWFALAPICSVIPMGTIASERRNGTIETLMTAPVTDVEVVTAKFLSSWAVYALLWAPVWVYFFVLSRFVDTEFGPVGSGFVGTMLLGAAYLSIGVLASALTRSQIIAAVVAFCSMFILFLLGILDYVLSEGPWQDVFHHLNVWAHMDDWGRGLVDTRYLIYYVSLTLFCLFCSVRALETRRWR